MINRGMKLLILFIKNIIILPTQHKGGPSVLQARAAEIFKNPLNLNLELH